MKPLAIDLFCGLGGWTEGLIAQDYRVIGFDIERRPYPAQLVLQDVLTLHGSQFRNADLIVASPPCQTYSHRAMPWGALWIENHRMDDDGAPPSNYRGKDPIFNHLFWACFRIQREACEAAGRHIPMVVENVKGAQPWVGRAAWHYGAFYLWGDVPALMPSTLRGGAMKNTGGTWFNIGQVGQKQLNNNPVHAIARDGVKQHGSGRIWFDRGIASLPSSSPLRKAASAKIAKIPFDLADYIARVFKP